MNYDVIMMYILLGVLFIFFVFLLIFVKELVEGLVVYVELGVLIIICSNVFLFVEIFCYYEFLELEMDDVLVGG